MTDKIRTELLTLAARADGCTRMEVKEDMHDVQRVIEKLIAEGLLFKAKMGHRTVRYYTDRRTAATVAHSNNIGIVINPRRPAHFDPSTPGIITEKTKFTVCPSPSVGAVHVKQLSNW